MKILIYNWVQLDDPALAGGGVTVYLRNVIEELLSREGVTVYFLSAGKEYRAFRRAPRIVASKNSYENPRLKTFTMLNSPLKAPAHDAFYSIDLWREDEVTVRLFRDFLRTHGPFDAVHIHNLEGIGSKVLSLPKSHNLQRLFYTFHNYMPLCPQIELLYNGRQLCTDFREGYRCVGCLRHENRMEDLIPWARAASLVDISGLAGHPLGGFLFDLIGGTTYYYKAVRNLLRDTYHGFKTGFRYWHLRQRSGVGQRHSWQASSKTPKLSTVPLDRRAGKAESYRRWRE